MILPHADVAELADAQVSEACDGDIVEVQVLSSAPFFRKMKRAHVKTGLASFCLILFWNHLRRHAYLKTYQTETRMVSPQKSPTLDDKRGVV